MPGVNDRLIMPATDGEISGKMEDVASNVSLKGGCFVCSAPDLRVYHYNESTVAIKGVRDDEESPYIEIQIAGIPQRVMEIRRELWNLYNSLEFEVRLIY